MGFRKANALANLQKAGVAVANQGDTRRGQDIVAGTAANRQANDLYSDTLDAENDAAENQRKLGESQVDFAVRQQKLKLDDRKAAVDANLRQQGLDETTRNNYAKSIEGYNKGMVAGQDPLSMFAGLIEQTDYATASKIDPQNAALYLERMKGQK